MASYGDLGATWKITHDFNLVDSFHYGNWNEPAQYTSTQCSLFSTSLIVPADRVRADRSPAGHILRHAAGPRERHTDPHYQFRGGYSGKPRQQFSQAADHHESDRRRGYKFRQKQGLISVTDSRTA